MKYFILTFGCQMNQSDSERIASVFEASGFFPAQNLESSDIAIITMCSVRQMAADRVFGLEQKFRDIKKCNPDFLAVLTGCVVESDKKRFAGFFDHILDINTLPDWKIPELIKNYRKVKANFGGTQKTSRKINGYFTGAPKYTRTWSVLVPISQGCDNYCSYCVVPYTRGPLICRPWEEILSEAKNAVALGAKEIWLLGQNVNNYHSKNVNFAKLLRMVNSISGDFWIRFTSSHPKDFTNEAVLAMAESTKVTPYLNLPIQSGDDEILEAMKRPYNVAKYKKLVGRLRKSFLVHRNGLEANLAVSTDVIVGFPGETKKQFTNTATVFRAIKYDMAYIACYSQRNGTDSSKLADNVDLLEKKRREEEINEIIKTTALAHNKKYLGKTVDVLVDELRKSFALGKTRSYKTVKLGIAGNKVNPGDFVRVKITGAKPFGLAGTIIENGK